MSDVHSPQTSLSALTMAMLGGLVLVLTSGLVVLVLAGKDPTTFVLFVTGPLVTTVTAALVGRRVTAVEEVARTVERQTNGLLSQSIANLHEHLDEQTQELLPAPTHTPAPAAPDSRLPQQPARLRVQPQNVADSSPL